MPRRQIAGFGFALGVVATLALGFWLGRNFAAHPALVAPGFPPAEPIGGTTGERRADAGNKHAGATSALGRPAGQQSRPGWPATVAPLSAETLRRELGYDFLMNAWTQKEGVEAVGQWLGQMTAHPHYDRIAQRYSAVVAAKDPGAALRWAATINDPNLKKAAVDFVNNVSKPKR